MLNVCDKLKIIRKKATDMNDNIKTDLRKSVVWMWHHADWSVSANIAQQSAGSIINTLNAELNPICHLLALLEAHHILHVGRIRVK